MNTRLFPYHLVNHCNTLMNPDPCKYTSYLIAFAMCICTHLRYRYIVKMVHGNYIVLTPKWLGGASLQLLAAHLPSNLFGIPMPAKYKVSESAM